MMYESKISYEQTHIQKKSRKIILDEIIKTLNEKGNFELTILLDDRGMILSDYNTTITMERESIAAMFSLINTVINRTVKNLNLESKELIVIKTNQGVFKTCDFSLQNYNRKMILVVYQSTIPNSNASLKSTKFKQKKFNDLEKYLGFKISFWRLFKVYITHKLKILPDLENISRNIFRIKKFDSFFNDFAKNKVHGEEYHSTLFKDTIREIQAIFKQ
ncbi:MAG: hypothetical protein K9W44_16570 [Candidatus Lokiarchaeota archaeon]|nr:hypothetical protein [Candidatus Harpocratesius repetitus]